MQGAGIGQKVNGQQVRLLPCSPSSRLSPPKRTDLPVSPSPASGVCSQHLSGTRKEQPCQTQGSVFNIIMTAVKTVNITAEPKGGGERRTSLGQVWGQETKPTLISTIPAVTGTHSFPPLGPNQQRLGALTKGRGPRCRVWGLCGSHPFHMGQDPVYMETTCLLFTCSVSSLL